MTEFFVKSASTKKSFFSEFQFVLCKKLFFKTDYIQNKKGTLAIKAIDPLTWHLSSRNPCQQNRQLYLRP